MIEPFFVEVMRSWSSPISVFRFGWYPDGGRHAAEQRRYFGACLYEAENIINEEQHVEFFFVAEIFRNGEAGQADAQTSAGRFRHLPVNQSAT